LRVLPIHLIPGSPKSYEIVAVHGAHLTSQIEQPEATFRAIDGFLGVD
jgi:hypothetical protein